ncbi:GGDEF domain-containing protein [Conexibacter woesei]|uniref:GGDEF domain-containing protein n=1 Tax=Conexibacter woesei TaxID=191495 RepID=UPI00041DFDF6|nr:GGDEF domain-containing protein [Conexibacter woesei]
MRADAAELLRAVGAEVLCRDERVAAAEAVRAERPHVVLLDHGLDGGGRQLVRDVAGDPELLGVAVILAHPDADADAVVAALRDGAADVWTATGADPELIARVRVAYRSRQLLDLALRRYSNLEDLAYRDELTELPNRRGASRQIDVLLSRARRHGHQLALLLIDADRFKRVNDEHGHAAGDVVLREIAARLRERVRREDIVGRWGGEEFVIALPETTPDGAAAVAESLREAIAGTPIEAGDDLRLGVTVSIGVAAWTGQELEELVDRADRALYAAKAAGRDRVVLEATAHAA